MSRPSRPQGSGRHAFLLGLFVLCFVAVACRLVWIQTVRASTYAERAFNQRLKDIELPPRRGTIYDREGEPLAVSVEARTIFVSPNRIADKEGVARALADTLGGSVRTYRKKLAKKSGFEYVARKVDLDRATALEKLDLEGVGFLDDYRRLYPSGELACQILGFVGVDDEGLEGIEREYNDTLGGVPGVILGERDPQGRPIPGGIQKEIDATHGHDVVLTIDKDIQYETQVQLAAAVKKWKAKSGSVVIMNPKTGEIYAMASTPGFNPNTYGKAKASAVRNKPLSDAYEPGSTLKCLTASAVVDRGYYTPKSKFTLPPTLNVGGRTIHEAHGRGTVRWSLTEIVTHSSNVGTVKLGLKLGIDGLYDSFSRFGLTEKTGVDFPGEAIGWLPKPDQWSASSIGNIPFGQGVSVTPLQLSRAVAGIANQGVMPTPHFLLDVPNEDSEPKGWPRKRAISEKAAAQVTGMLTAVVTEGTGGEAAVPGYTVAGKTGTAQKALSGGRGYSGGKYVGSFIGFLPAEDPEVLVCVTMDEPANSIYGGTVAAPTFARLAQFTVEHLKVPPSSSDGKSSKSKAKNSNDAGVGTVSDDQPRD
ncbi:MAG TPA: penicillin-binding protein 2 [Coriobacteriia bacterium]|nr:penicillin-binding protein 2 [Coriobacteriia bacterium]